MPIKYARKLTDQILQPSSLEKTNVKLADGFFHESTVIGLEHYATNYPDFKETAQVFRIIRDWFNVVNVKSPYEDQRTGDERRKKIKNDDRGSALVYLRKFLNWVEKWQRSKKAGLSRQTRQT